MESNIVIRIYLLLIFIGIHPWGATAQGPPSDWVHYKSFDILSQSRDTLKIALIFEIEEGMHIQADQVDDELIPTAIKLNLPSCLNLRKVMFEPAQSHTIPEHSLSYKVFIDSLKVTAVITSSCPAPLEDILIVGELTYQACNAISCFFPKTTAFYLH